MIPAPALSPDDPCGVRRFTDDTLRRSQRFAI
jgi:hypothetical protein